MSDKFEQAIDESFRAVDTFAQAMTDIQDLVRSMDRAVASKTSMQVRIGTNNSTFDDFLHSMNALLGQRDGEDLPPRVIRIVAYAETDRTQRRDLCRLSPSRAGYPVAVLSFRETETSCPDFESLEYKLADIMRDSRSGLKLKALMELANAKSRPALSGGPGPEPEPAE